MFFDGALTPGSRAAPATPEQTPSTTAIARMPFIGAGAFSTFPRMAEHEILVWSDYI